METRRLVLTLTGIAVALVVVLGGLSIALLAGGGGDDNGGGNSSQASPTPNLPGRVAGELRLFGPDPITLDPACAADSGSAEYIVQIFSCLVSFDKDLNLIPDIAAALPDVSGDGMVYTFHLRQNVAFHDNSRRVTAGGFQFSMERALNPKTLSTLGEGYLDDIVGGEDFVKKKWQEGMGI